TGHVYLFTGLYRYTGIAARAQLRAALCLRSPGVMPPPESEPRTIGGRIRLVRTQRGMTLEQLADKAEISKSFLWEVEQGSDISGERLLRVANALSASLEYLMRGETVSDYKPASVEI